MYTIHEQKKSLGPAWMFTRLNVTLRNYVQHLEDARCNSSGIAWQERKSFRVAHPQAWLCQSLLCGLHILKHVGYAYSEKSLCLLVLFSVVARRPLVWCFERVDVKGSLTAKKLFEVQVFRCGWTCLWVKLSRMSANRLSALSQGHGVSLVSRLLPLLGQLRFQYNANHSGELFAEDGDVEVTLPLQINLLDSSNKDWQYQFTTSDVSVDWEEDMEGSRFHS